MGDNGLRPSPARGAGGTELDGVGGRPPRPAPAERTDREFRDAMLCPDCRRLPALQRLPLPAGPPPAGEPMRPLLCVRCGLLLPSAHDGATGVMLRMLSRLARFGLAAEGAPILRGTAAGR